MPYKFNPLSCQFDYYEASSDVPLTTSTHTDLTGFIKGDGSHLSADNSTYLTTTGDGAGLSNVVHAEVDPTITTETNGFTITRGTTPATLTVAASGSVSGTNTGDNVEVTAQTNGFSITKGTTPKTLTVDKTITLTSSDDTSVSTLPAGTKTLVATDGNISGSSGSCTGNSATVTGFTLTAGKTLTVTDNATISGTPLSNPMSALGDILYEDANPAPARLAGNITTTKKFLRQTGDGSISAIPAWDTLIASDVPDISATYLPLHSKADTAGVADTVTNGVYTTGNQSIAGIKTLSDATEASSATVGGTIVSGGLAVAKRVYATDMTVTNPIVGSIAKRVTTASDATSITPNSDTADITYQLNTQSAGTLTINADGGTPVNGRAWLLKIKSTNVQTFSWNALYVGGTYALPISTTGGGKIDYYAFIYDSVNSKFHFTGSGVGF